MSSRAQTAYYSGNAALIDSVMRKARRTGLVKGTQANRARKGAQKLMKRRGGTATVTKKTRQTDYGQQNQLSKQSYKAGRKPRVTVQYLNKLIKTNQSHYILRFGGMNPFSAGQGYYKLNFGPITAGGSGVLPCHLYDITSCINLVGGNVTYAQPGHCALQSGATTNVTTFSPLLQQTPDGASTISTWAAEDLPGRLADITSYPLQNSILDWFQARFVLYGARNRPVKYLIQLVQFNDEDLDPRRPSNLKRTNLFNALIKPFTYNPIADVDSNTAKRMKVLKSWTHLIQPDTSTNQDSSPLQKEFNVFMRMNRKCRWDWSERVLVSNSLNAYNEADYVSLAADGNSTDYHEYVHPRARVYLMIRALSTTTGEFSNLIHPSYDMKIRVRHTYGS